MFRSRKRPVFFFGEEGNNERSPLLNPGLSNSPETVGGENAEFLNSTSSSHFSSQEELYRKNSTPSRHTHIGEVGDPNLLSQKYESLIYDHCENTVFLEDRNWRGYSYVQRTDILRWVVIFFIALLTACTAALVDICIDVISQYKFRAMKKYTDHCVKHNCMIIPLALWLGFNSFFVLLASLIVTYIAPVAAGSGIPAIKCYLNGIKVPEVVRFKTFLVKAFGVVFSLLGGLAVGKEGPMIHCGAVIAAGISQGKSTTFQRDFKIFGQFREDHEKRDFVSAGAAAGVAAAFGAPVGGVLFALEEGASFWNQSLTWRIFFCSVMSAFSLNLLLSSYHQHPGQLSYSGLINFGKFEDINYSFNEILVYIIIGLIGGLLGALFNHINFKLTVFRLKYSYQKWKMVFEAVIVSVCTATAGYLMIHFSDDCQVLGNDPIQFPLQYKCGDGEYSAMGAIWFQTPEASVRSLFHDAPGTWSHITLTIFFVVYFFISCWTYGLSVSSGIFIPTLLVGAAWGRLLGIFAEWIFNGPDWVNPGKFAVLGAAAMLGGVVRMTLSLTVILVEATGNITLALPIVITLLVSKWVGDFFNEGLYDLHIQLNRIPFLPWGPPPTSQNIYASEVMSTPVKTFLTVEKVGRIVDILTTTSHNGFPVVDNDPSSFLQQKVFGRFRGLILRWQIIVLLQHKLFNETNESCWPDKKLTLKDFRDAYPRYPPIQQVQISSQERELTIDLRPYMYPSPYTVSHSASLPRIFRLFRALGLRHLVVVNDRNEVAGMVTRKDLARFRGWKHRGKMGLEELHVTQG